jgi:hypothetical protein
VGGPEGKRPPGRPVRRWEDNTTMDVQEMRWRDMDWIDWSEQGQVAGPCECGNEPSGSIKCGEFLDYLMNC